MVSTSTTTIPIIVIVHELNKYIQTMSHKDIFLYQNSRLNIPWFKQLDDYLCTTEELTSTWSKAHGFK